MAKSKGRLLVIVRVVTGKEGSTLQGQVRTSNERVRLETNGQGRCVGGMMSRGTNSRCGERLLGRIRPVSRVRRHRGRGREVVDRVTRIRQLTRPRLQGHVARPCNELSTRRPLLNHDGRVVRVKRGTIRLRDVQVPMKWGTRLSNSACGDEGLAQDRPVRVRRRGDRYHGRHPIPWRIRQVVRSLGRRWGRSEDWRVMCRYCLLGDGRTFATFCAFGWVWDRPSFLCRTVISFAPFSGSCSKTCPDSFATKIVSRYRFLYFVVLCLSRFDILLFPRQITVGSTDGSAAFDAVGKRLV